MLETRFDKESNEVSRMKSETNVSTGHTLTSKLRRGAAVWAVIAVVAMTTGTSMMAIQRIRVNMTVVQASGRNARAEQISHGCTDGAFAVLPSMLDSIMMQMTFDTDGSFHSNEIYLSQIDADMFHNTTALLHENAVPTCITRLDEMNSHAPMPGYSSEGGCFKLVTMTVEGGYTRAIASADDLPTTTSRTTVARGIIGPVQCN